MRSIVVVLLCLAACGGEPEASLDQGLFGRWDGNIEFAINGVLTDMPVSLGLSISGEKGWLTDLCPTGGAALVGAGSNGLLEVNGEITCAPVPLPGCESVKLTWNYAAILLTGEDRTHVTVSGRYVGCNNTSAILAIGDLVRH